MLTADVRAKIQDLAHLASPLEGCGIVNSMGEAIAIDNLADSQSSSFTLDPSVWIDQSVECVWHSHTDGSSWSLVDIKSCKQLGIPFYLFQLPEGKEYYYDPKMIEPYEGREWLSWVSDCYTLIRDWYLQEMKVQLPDFDRELILPDGKYAWLDPGWDMYRQELSKYGFVCMGTDVDLKFGDIILMNYRSPNLNHAAVYVDVEQNMMLHHLLHRLSGLAVYGYEQRKITDSIWRLPSASMKYKV